MIRRLAFVALISSAYVVASFSGAAAGGGCHPGPDAELTSSDRALVNIEQCEFADTVTYVSPGTEVTWANKDAVPHSVSGAASSWGSEELLAFGDRVTYSFERAGVFPYYCVLHPTMVGAVVVGDGGPAIGGSSGIKKVDAKAIAAVDVAADPPAGTTGSATVLAAAGTILVGLAAAAWFGLRRLGSRATLEA